MSIDNDRDGSHESGNTVLHPPRNSLRFHLQDLCFLDLLSASANLILGNTSLLTKRFNLPPSNQQSITDFAWLIIDPNFYVLKNIVIVNEKLSFCDQPIFLTYFNTFANCQSFLNTEQMTYSKGEQESS